ETAKPAATLARAQEASRQHEGLDKHLRIFDGHLVFELISGACELLDDVHAAGVDEAASSQPRRVDKLRGVDDERVPFPFAYAVPIVVGLARRPRVPLAVVRGDVAELRGSAA